MRCALSKTPLSVDDERSSHNRRERHFRNPVGLESLVHLEPLPVQKMRPSSSRWRSGDGRPPGPRSSPSCKGLRGAICRCWGPPDRW